MAAPVIGIDSHVLLDTIDGLCGVRYLLDAIAMAAQSLADEAQRRALAELTQVTQDRLAAVEARLASITTKTPRSDL